jgi:hypothetical protein
MRYSRYNNHSTNYQSYYQIREERQQRIDDAQPKCIINNSFPKEEGQLVFANLSGSIPYSNSFIQEQGGDNLLSDIYKHWNNSDKQYSIRPDKYWWHYMLSRVDNHLLQKLTNNNTLYSYLATRKTVDMLARLLREHDPEDLKQFAKSMQSQAEGDPDAAPNQKILDAIDKASNAVQNQIKKEIDKAESLPGGMLSGDAASDIEQLETLPKDVLSKLKSIKKGQIANFLKSTIDYAIEATAGKDKVLEESIFEADEIEAISNIENFAHIAMFDDLMVTKKTKHVSFDIYIDDSGSMTSKIYGGDFNGSFRRTIAHLLSFRLMQLNILRKTYLFAHTGELREIEKKDLFKPLFNGGTDIYQCIKQAKKQNRPAILVTDGYDRFDRDKGYYKDMYILVIGTDLPSCFGKYAENNQILFFSNGEFTNKYSIEDKYGTIRPKFKSDAKTV